MSIVPMQRTIEPQSVPSSSLSEADWRGVAQRLKLSNRELQIAQGFVDGRDELGVALEIGISEHTVHTYVRRMYSKCGVRARCELIVQVFVAHLANMKTLSHGPTFFAQNGSFGSTA